VLYRLGLGRLLGHRFLLLEHRGRRSGKTRHTVIEVIDRDIGRGSFFVVSAWGTKADWYQNALAAPSVRVKTGSKDFRASAATVAAQQAELHLRNYAHAHPAAFRELGSLLVGVSTRDTEETVRRFSTTMPVVEFVPQSSDTHTGAA
jgi:deazaflavin-dependent oxidoreductase (nitroreductase family)